LPEGLEGITRLHALVAEHAPGSWAELPPDQVAGQVIVGIETDRGPWVTALRAAGYQVFAIRARNIGHHAALRQLANRLVGILHGCLKTGTLYDENTAWQHHRTDLQPAAQHRCLTETSQGCLT